MTFGFSYLLKLEVGLELGSSKHEATPNLQHHAPAEEELSHIRDTTFIAPSLAA